MNPTTNYVQPTITVIEDDQVCPYCHANHTHLSILGGTEEWYGDMRCTEIHCAACNSEFVVGCDIIIEDGTLLHDHDEEFQRQWWADDSAPTQSAVGRRRGEMSSLTIDSGATEVLYVFYAAGETGISLTDLRDSIPCTMERARQIAEILVLMGHVVKVGRRYEFTEKFKRIADKELENL